LVEVLTQREIANQEKATFAEEERAQTVRVQMERAKGTADMQAQLASAQVNVEIKKNQAQARQAEGEGEAAYVELTGKAEATKTQAVGVAQAKAVEALGLARAEGFKAQTAALGQGATALVAVANAVADGKITVVPEVLVAGGGGGSLDGLAATLMRYFKPGTGSSVVVAPSDAEEQPAAGDGGEGRIERSPSDVMPEPKSGS
jgi:uncharacterized membrane protein YqiK